MEKGLKNLNHAYRSAQKKNITDDEHDNDDIGTFGLEEEQDDQVLEKSKPNQFTQGYDISQRPVSDISSIQSMLDSYPRPAQT
jgi:hypothetical protein